MSNSALPFTSLKSKHELFLLALILILALWIRWPRVGEGMPFFYREDEAHHYNRIANMVKSGDLNPHYFHKPSLHFYLRIPVHAAGFIWNVREGNLRSVQEIVTRDEFGVGDYAFSISHPGLVKWNRMLSLLISVGLVLLTYLISKELSFSSFAALVSSLLAASSPALAADSAVIGVDVPMAALVMLSSLWALRFLRTSATAYLALSCLAAGFAISTKYNALPAALIPLIALALSNRFSLSHLFTACLGIVTAFFLASPFILAELPTFLDHLAYEVWHYGVAAHEGNSAEPGWPQAVFYLRWLNADAIGPLVAAFGTMGVFFLLATRKKEYAVAFLFPILFAALMISQRTNFPRNMLVLIPFVALIGTYTLLLLIELCNLRGRAAQAVLALFLLVGVGIPLKKALAERFSDAHLSESRLELPSFLLQLRDENTEAETAVAGQLQLPLAFFNSPGFIRYDQKVLDPLELYERGYEFVVNHRGIPISQSAQPLLKLVKNFAGAPQLERIVRDPAIDIYSFDRDAVESQLSTFKESIVNHPALGFDISSTAEDTCAYLESDSGKSLSENYCWTQRRHLYIKLLKLAEHEDAFAEKTTLFVTTMSPWKDQKLVFSAGDWEESRALSPGEWESWSFQIPTEILMENQGLFLETSKINSPKILGLSEDKRRLGAAIKRISLYPVSISTP